MPLHVAKTLLAEMTVDPRTVTGAGLPAPVGPDLQLLEDPRILRRTLGERLKPPAPTSDSSTDASPTSKPAAPGRNHRPDHIVNGQL